MTGKLIVSEGGRDRIHELCEDRLVVGRGPGVDLHLKDVAVAARHCEIRRTPEGFRVVDLETAGGTRVNGHFINVHRLGNGDTIEVGGARLTYLGESAAPPAPPRQPVQKLTVHPRDEDGQPRRFYRHESQSSGSRAAVTLAGILGALGLIALLVLWSANREYGPPGQKQFADAKELIKDGRQESLEKAVRILESLPSGAVHTLELRDALDEARSKIAEHQIIAAQKEETRRYDDIKKAFQEQKGAQFLRPLVKTFLQDYPTSARADELREILQRAELGGPDRERSFEALAAAIRDARLAKNFKVAREKLAEAEADADFKRIYAERLKIQRATVESEFKRHFEAMRTTAEQARSRGDSAQAIRIYTALAEVGIEPYSAQAKAALEELN